MGHTSLSGHAAHKQSRRMRVVGLLSLLGSAAFFIGGLWCASVWAEDAALIAPFRPYTQGMPRVPGLDPGVMLSRANAQLAKDVLPAEVLQLVEAGDVELLIQDATDLPPR
ncbi:MAG: hypothetical protein HOP18_06585, partial [Deltaproteobacteria bacterium]|nr:hypothetical protein [Deltaproteobacteria bacterium]